MAQLRIVRPTRFKFGMAYLRWGPLWQRRGMPLDSEVCTYMARVVEEEYVSKRKLLLRMLPNAFVGSPRAAVIQSAFSVFTRETPVADNTYRTFVLDLAPELEDLRKRLDPKWRNKLSGSEKNDLRVVAGSGNDEYRTFSLIYNQMRKRKAFETTVDVEEFGGSNETCQGLIVCGILICEDRGVPVAGLVASAIGDTAIYLLGATSDDGLHSKGAYLLQWSLIKCLKENGFKWYDLGGIDPEGNPGVYSFKRGLSGTDANQISPLVACTSPVSYAVVRAGLAIDRTARVCKSALRFPITLNPEVSRN